MDKNLEKLIQKRVELLYGKSHSSSIMERLKSQIAFYKNKIDAFKHNKSRAMTEKDVVLITYADQVSTKNEMPLKTLGSFLKKYCINSINSVHILPFFPYSSDDGFSVVDYKKVNPDVGDWSDIEELRKDFHLMFDAVINHISAKSDWFKEFLAGNPKYKDFFITCDPSEDLSEVTRPRSLPLLTKFDTSEGEKWVWTTFSEDQVDLNFDSPELALAVMDILLFYASKGASIIRFDAIAYIWKKVGTNCIHLKEVHEFVKLMKNVFDAVAPHVTIITETNVPHKENISYFGENGDEAQMIYQFTLPPLTAHAILRQDSVAIREWARTLEHPGYGNTYFNFTASHDGVGLRPASGIISDDEIDFLAQTAKERGGHISTKRNADGSDSPYELNINYYSFLSAPEDSMERSVAKFMLSQAILLVMPGVPGIYFHSLFGSENYSAGVEAGHFRTINREKLNKETLERELSDKDSRRYQIFSFYRKLLEIRSENPAFNPLGKFSFPNLGNSLFCIYKSFADSAILALNNVTEKEITLSSSDVSKILGSRSCKDIISGKVFPEKITINPYQIMWLKND